ncbi:hypothetical protein SLEP1_g2940 [Rubroshorea leprosula]|uniref:Transposase (putative) gypsy type domain-containing protein n=1 Tax=Rubroshorea leprosula TaxID=152421 RepID=A0AAV5HR37_9ROSI|nr:hypothetical protein SLEP1_g2936 [Rubroshorea leprosula]GKU88711.1 hypothetical protein SLEP1_g2940 [Rubroshorea leprosula]
MPKTLTHESNASSSARDNGGDHQTSSSSSSSSKETPSREEWTGNVVSNVSDLPVIGEWESKTIMGRLSNLRKAPKDLPAGFRFKAALHHEVADSVPSISGYRKLEEMVRAYHIPRTILFRTGAQNERACTVSQTGWIPVYVDYFEAGLRFPLPGLIFDLLADYELALTQLMPNSIRFIIGFMLLCERLEVPAKAIMFRSLFQCRLCPNSRGTKWYYLSGREKSQLFKNVRNKVARWKRQFIFVRDTRIERISNDLAARLSEWRVPNAHVNYPQLLPRDTDLKNQLLEHARRDNLIDLEALVTSEQLTVFGFVNVANLFTAAYSNASVSEPRAHEVVERAALRTDRHDSTSSHLQHHNHGARSTVAPARRQGLAPSSGLKLRPLVRASVHARRLLVKMRSPSCGAERVGGLNPRRRLNLRSRARQTLHQPRCEQQRSPHLRRPQCRRPGSRMQSFVPPVARQQARTFVQQHGGQVAMVKLMDAFSYAVALFESEQGARSQNNELSTNCKQLAAEKASLVDDAAKEEAARVEERAKKAEAERDRALNELGSLRHQVAEADKNLNVAEGALNELNISHGRSVSIARAQGAEWLVGSAAFQDAVAVASQMESYSTSICIKE